MVNEYQDWEYCSVHMSVQKTGQKAEHNFEGKQIVQATQKAIEDSGEASIQTASTQIASTQTDDDSSTTHAIQEHLVSLKNTLNNSERLIQTASLMSDAVEVTSVEAGFSGDFNTDADVDSGQGSSYELSQLIKSDEVSTTTPAIDDSINQQHDQSVDIDVFIPSLLLSFESLLKRVFDDLLNGLKNYDLYSMGFAQYLKLEDEQINGNVVKLRYRLPIDNVKLVFEAMNH